MYKYIELVEGIHTQKKDLIELKKMICLNEFL